MLPLALYYHQNELLITNKNKTRLHKIINSPNVYYSNNSLILNDDIVNIPNKQIYKLNGSEKSISVSTKIDYVDELLSKSHHVLYINKQYISNNLSNNKWHNFSVFDKKFKFKWILPKHNLMFYLKSS